MFDFKDQDDSPLIPVEDRILAVRIEIEEVDRRLAFLEQRRRQRADELKRYHQEQPET